MKILLLLLLLLPCTARADITSNLVAHWKFDNDLVDEVSSNTFTEDAGTATFSTSALPFSGSGTTHNLVLTTDDRLSSGSTVSLTGAWSYAFWIKTTVNLDNIFEHDGGGGGQDVVFRLIAAAIRGNVIGEGTVDSTTDCNDGSWHHVVFTYDGVNIGGLTMYVDGTPAEATGSGVAVPATTTGDVVIPETTDPPTGGDVEWDELRIYSRELSSDDVAELYAYTGDSSGNPLLLQLQYGQ